MANGLADQEAHVPALKACWLLSQQMILWPIKQPELEIFRFMSFPINVDRLG